jgi:hypothetical protein
MRKLLTATLLTSGLSLALCWGGSSPTASADVGLPAFRMMRARAQHPEMAARLVAHLRTRYPHLEARLLKALVKLDAQHPGLEYAIPRHLLEDLGDDALVAVDDVLQARQRSGSEQRRGAREFVATHYPGLRTKLLESLSDQQPLAECVRDNVRATMKSQFPTLRRHAMIEASKLADESFSGLPVEMARESRPLAWLRDKHPEFFAAVRSRLIRNQGPQIRQAAIAVLAGLEKDATCQIGPRLERLTGFVTANYPNLLSELLDQRLRRPQMPMALSTLASKHPELIGKVRASLEKNFPTLRNDIQQDLAEELPGVREEVRSFLQANYPDVAAQLPKA